MMFYAKKKKTEGRILCNERKGRLSYNQNYPDKEPNFKMIAQASRTEDATKPNTCGLHVSFS